MTIDAPRTSFFLQLRAIAGNTFREAIRDRILYNLVLFVLIITASAILLGELTDGQEARTIVNIGLNAMLLFGVFIAIFVGVGLVSKEIEKRTVYAIFSKPRTARRVYYREISGLVSHAVGQCRRDGNRRVVGFALCRRRKSCLFDLGRHTFDISGIIDLDGGCDPIFLVLFARTFGPSDFFCFYHWPHECLAS